MLPMFLLAMHQLNYSEYLTSINQPIRDLLTTSKSSDVRFVVDDHNSSESEIIDGIYRTVSEISPTSRVRFDRSNTSWFRVSRETLILYIYLSDGPPDVRRSREIADIVVHQQTPQKVALITISEDKYWNEDFEVVFTQMWSKQLLNAVILQLPKFRSNGSAIMVHRYNPFSNAYDRTAYTPGVEWFPDKSSNLHGYTLRTLVFTRPGFLNVTADSEGHAVTISGTDAKMLEVLVRVLNFTPDIHNLPTMGSSLFEIMAAENIDITSVSLPIFSDTTMWMTEQTVPLTVEMWCPVVPIDYVFNVINTRAILGVAMNCIIVCVFWAVSRVLKLDRKRWQLLKIYGAMLSMSVSTKPTRIIEKTLLIFVFLASLYVSTNLYADLTTSSLGGATRTIYKDFQELDRSGLIPVVLKPLFNVTFDTDDRTFVALKRKALTTKNLIRCGHHLERHKNITCFMDKLLADMMIYSQSRRGVRCMIVCENLCYSKPPVGYFLRKNSPLVERISEITIRLQMSGIRDKWRTDYIGKFSPRKTHFINVDDEGKTPLVRILIPIGLCGGFLSSFVFCAEIVLGWIKNNEGRVTINRKNGGTYSRVFW